MFYKYRQFLMLISDTSIMLTTFLFLCAFIKLSNMFCSLFVNVSSMTYLRQMSGFSLLYDHRAQFWEAPQVLVKIRSGFWNQSGWENEWVKGEHEKYIFSKFILEQHQLSQSHIFSHIYFVEDLANTILNHFKKTLLLA